jgi:hypothetical protein
VSGRGREPVATHHVEERRQVGRAVRFVDDRSQLAKVGWSEQPRGDDRERSREVSAEVLELVSENAADRHWAAVRAALSIWQQWSLRDFFQTPRRHSRDSWVGWDRSRQTRDRVSDRASYDGGRGCHVATSDPIAEIIGDYRAFAPMQRDRLVARGIDIAPYPLSHLAVRVADWDLYVHQRTLLERRATRRGQHELWMARALARLVAATR